MKMKLLIVVTFLISQLCNGMVAKLFDAISAGDANMCEKLLDDGADVNAENFRLFHNTPLMHAIQLNKSMSGCFELIMNQNDVDVNLTNDLENTALHLAAVSANELMCFALVHNPKTDVNVTDLFGITPLMLVIMQNKTLCFDRIMKRRDVDVNVQTYSKGTALNYAAESVNERMCIELCKHSIHVTDLNVKNDRGCTPLMNAIKFDRKNCFDAIMAREDVNVSLADDRRQTALHYAAAFLNEQMCVKLAQNPNADVNAKSDKEFTPLMLAITMNKVRCFDMIMKREDLDVNAAKDLDDVNAAKDLQDEEHDCWTALHFAAESENEQMCVKLAQYPKTDVNLAEAEDELTPLMIAIKQNRKRCFDALRQREDLDVNAQSYKGWTALHYASESESEEMCVDLAKDHKTDVNVQTSEDELMETPLMLAIYKNNEKCFDAIMKRKELDANVQNQDGETPLMLAIETNNKKFFDAIMKRKELDINVQNQDGETPLVLAIEANNKEFFDAIMKCEDLDVNLTTHDYIWSNSKGCWSDCATGSAITIAADSENEQMCVELAKKFSTDVNVKDEDGVTPLMLAARRNNVECIKALLRRDVNTEEKDKYGKTALDYAKDRVESEGNTEVAQKDLESIQKMFNFNRRKGILWIVNSIDKNNFKRKRVPKDSKPKTYV